MNKELIESLKAQAKALRDRKDITWEEQLAATDMFTAANHLETADKKRAEAAKELAAADAKRISEARAIVAANPIAVAPTPAPAPAAVEAPKK